MMLLQTDPSLPPEINHEGCHFMSLLGIAQERAGVEFDSEAVLDLYKTCTIRSVAGRPVMRTDCYVFWPQHVINSALAVLGITEYRYDQVGSFVVEGGVTHWWSLGSIHHKVSATILEGITARGNHHFRQGDRSGAEVYNPDPTARIVTELRRVFYMAFNPRTGRPA